MLDENKVIFLGNRLRAVSPEGVTKEVDSERIFKKISEDKGISTGDIILPDGTKAIFSRHNMMIWVIENTPGPYSLRWISENSSRPYGSGAEYRTVRISLPYFVLFCVFIKDNLGNWVLSRSNEGFFRNDPIKTMEDQLYFPALLNCSKWPDSGKSKSRPFAWICTQYLKHKYGTIKDLNLRIRAAIDELRYCLFETGFNYSSEANEGNSWFTASKGVDERISTVKNWEEATKENELFAIDVNWIQTKKSIKEMAEHIFGYQLGKSNDKLELNGEINSNYLAKLIFSIKPEGKKEGKEKDELAF